MHAIFRPQFSVSKRSRNLQNDRFNSSIVIRRALQRINLHSRLFCPAQIHSLQHRRKILRVQPAHASGNTHNCRAIVIFARKQQIGFIPIKALLNRRNLRLEFWQQIVITKFHQFHHITNLHRQSLPRLDGLTKAGGLLC